MPRLVVFGCSFTVGVGLPDVYPRHNVPSSIGWAALLGEKLNLEVLNRGVSGAGNVEILLNILNTELYPDDLCIVMWSGFVRHDRFLMNSEFGAGERANERTYVEKILNLDDIDWVNNNRNKNWLTIHHASCYLKQLGIRFYSLLGIADQGPVTGYKPENLTIPNFIEDIRPGKWIVDEALDGSPGNPGHPGSESQRLLSQMIYDRII